MTSQGHGAKEGVYHTQDGGDALGVGKKGHGNGRVGHEKPNEGGHDGSGLISGIHPNPPFFACTEGERPRLIVVGIDVVFSRGSYAREGQVGDGGGVGDGGLAVFVVCEGVVEVFGGVYLAAAAGGEAGA